MQRSSSTPVPQPHDNLVKWAFSQRRHAAALLKAALPPALVAAIDWSSLRVERGSFVSQALRGRHTDLVFSASLGAQPVYLYAVIEHQRDVEPLMVLRVGLYMMRLWESLVRDAPNTKRLPPILPILIHHSATGWTAATAFQDIVAGDGPARDAIERHIPRFELRLIDLSDGRAADLKEQVLTTLGKLVVWCLRVAGDDERFTRELKRVVSAFWEVMAAHDGAAAFEVLVRYIAATRQRMTEKDVFDRFERAAAPEDKEKVVSYLDEIRLSGRREGEREGKREGKRDGRAEMLLEQLQARFGKVPAEATARVEEATVAQLQRWTLRVLTAPTLAEVFGKNGPAPKARRPATPRKPSPRAKRAA